MRLRVFFGILLLCMASGGTKAATLVVPEIIAANLVTRLVGNAPPGNLIVSGVSVVTTTAGQSGLVNNIAFGTVNLIPLNLPAPGIMLTTGSINGGSNALASAGDVDVEAAVAAGAGSTSDAAVLQFNFSVPIGVTSISLDMIFATNETLGTVPIGVIPTVRDAVVVMLDGVNIAKFAKPDPVSIVMSNINTTSIFAAAPLGTIISGFDSVSQRETIIAPLLALPVHTLKIAIADHIDSLRDSAVILSNMRSLTPPPGATFGGTGVTITQGSSVTAIPPPGSPDPIPPRVRLVGNATVYVMQNGFYIDQGAIAVDNIDGNLTGGVRITSTAIDTAIVGPQQVKYSSIDFSGNIGTATRKVVVIPTSTLDVLPPFGVPPADLLLTASDFNGVLRNDARLAIFLTGAVFTDNVAVIGQITNDAPPVFPIGKTVVTFTQRDTAIPANFGTTQATVTVVGTNRAKAGVDIDLDGIPDSWEIAVFGLLTTASVTPPVPPAVVPTITDFDVDGLNDLLEWQLGTNPKLPNTNPASVSTDSWSVIFSNNPADTDGDGVIDALENASSVLNPAIVTGLPAGINSTVVYRMNAGVGNQLKSVHTDVPGTGAPLNILPAFGVISFAVKTAVVGGAATVRISSSTPFGVGAQFYKVNQAGAYSLIPLANVAVVSPNTIDLLLTDGGPLDLDGVVNGMIIDPIAVGSAPKILGGSGASGGCAIARPGSIDPLLPLLLLLSLFYLLRRRKAAAQLISPLPGQGF